MSSLPIPFRRVPPRSAWRRMPSPVLSSKSGFCNLFAWLAVETVFSETAARKSGRSLIDPFFGWIVLGEIPLIQVSFKFFCREMIRVVFCCKFLHLFAFFCSVHPTASWDSRETGSLRNRSWIPEKCPLWELTFLQHLFHAYSRLYLVFFLFFSFAVSSTMTTPFLDHGVRDRERPVLVSKTFFWIRCQPRIVRKCSRQFLDSDKWEHCTFGTVSNNSNNSTLPNSRIIVFVLLLNGL